VASFLAEKQALSDRYAQDLKCRTKAFVQDFGERPCSDLTGAELRKWLKELRGLHGRAIGSVTRNNTRRNLAVFFSYCMECEWIKSNPLENVKPEATQKSVVGIWTPQEAAKTLVAASPEIAPFIAIALFCGLRRSELERVTPKHIRNGLVEVTVTKTRGAARRFVRIRPCLEAWLKKFPLKEITPHQFRERMDAAIEDAGVEWPHNVMRHSFCSYALAHEKNLNELVLEMGHTNPHTLYAHYRELVTPKDAEIYWNLIPSSAEKLARS